MEDPDLITLFAAPLEKADIRHMIVGSIASSIYGEPRNTLDISMVVLLESFQIEKFPQLFPEEDFYLPPPEVIAIETRREINGHFNIIHHNTGLKADIYLSRNHPALPWALDHTRRISTQTCEVTLAPPNTSSSTNSAFTRNPNTSATSAISLASWNNKNSTKHFFNPSSPLSISPPNTNSPSP